MLAWLLGHLLALLWTGLAGCAWGLDLWLVRHYARRAAVRVGGPGQHWGVLLFTLGELRRAWERLITQTAYVAVGALALLLPASGVLTVPGLVVALLLLFPQGIAAYGAVLDWQEWRVGMGAAAPPHEDASDGD